MPVARNEPRLVVAFTVPSCCSPAFTDAANRNSAEKQKGSSWTELMGQMWSEPRGQTWIAQGSDVESPGVRCEAQGSDVDRAQGSDVKPRGQTWTEPSGQM